MKFIYFIFMIIFSGFAYLQWNDADPYIWMLTYGLVAYTALMAWFDHFSKVPSLFFMILILVWVLTYIPNVIEWYELGMPSIVNEMKAAQPYIKYTREFFGLIISLFALSVMYTAQNRREYEKEY